MRLSTATGVQSVQRKSGSRGPGPPLILAYGMAWRAMIYRRNFNGVRGSADTDGGVIRRRIWQAAQPLVDPDKLIFIGAQARLNATAPVVTRYFASKLGLSRTGSEAGSAT